MAHDRIAQQVRFVSSSDSLLSSCHRVSSSLSNWHLERVLHSGRVLYVSFVACATDGVGIQLICVLTLRRVLNAGRVPVAVIVKPAIDFGSVSFLRCIRFGKTRRPSARRCSATPAPITKETNRRRRAPSFRRPPAPSCRPATSPVTAKPSKSSASKKPTNPWYRSHSRQPDHSIKLEFQK